MEVSFQLVEDDYVAYADYWYQQTAKGRRALRGAYALGGLLFLGFAWMERDHEGYGWHNPGGYAVYMAISLVALGAIYLGFLWYIRPTMARWAVRFGPRRRMLLPCTVSVAKEGLQLRTAQGIGRLAWDHVEDIGSTWDHLFIILQGPGGLIIPKRAFASTEAYNLYYAAMMRHFNAAHRQPVPEASVPSGA